MSDYRITCCSTCDLSPGRIKALDVPCCSYHYIIDGKDYLDDLFTTRTPEEFYGLIDDGAMPTTSQVTSAQLVEMIEPILKQGLDVVHIEFSSGLSGGWESAVAAREELAAKYPERKLYFVDSLAASSGYGLLIDRAVELKEGGMDAQTLYNWLEENKLNLRHWFFTTNLTHLKRGGRVSGAAAAIGSIMNICPVMDVNSEGKLIVRKKVMGKKKAFAELVARMKEEAVGGKDYNGKCYISHSLRQEDAKILAAMVEETFPALKGKVIIENIGTVIGSHTGPGTVALFYFSTAARTL